MALFPRPPVPARPPPLLHHLQVDAAGWRLAVTEWPSAGVVSTTCVLLHATGFHSRCWDETIRRLPTSWRCLAVDARGHGRSDKPAPVDGKYPWAQMAREVVLALRQLGVSGAVGAGHSMGGYLLLHAALEAKELFSTLLLCDPVVFVEDAYTVQPDKELRVARDDGTNFVARRFNAFESSEQMYSRLQGKGSYNTWCDASLADYCAFGLLPASVVVAFEHGSGWGTCGNGQGMTEEEVPGAMRLACPPAVEAATYRGSTLCNDRHRYIELELPVTILRAQESIYSSKSASSRGTDFSASPTDPNLVQLFRRARDVHLSGIDHFIPMQDPTVVANHLLDLAKEVRDSSAAGERSRL